MKKGLFSYFPPISPHYNPLQTTTQTDKQRTTKTTKGGFMQFLPEYLSAKDICEKLSIHRSTLYAHIKKGKFPKQIKIGSCSRWERQAVLDWLEAQKGETMQ